MKPGLGSRAQTGMSEGSIPPSGMICDDCGGEMNDWIVTLNGALLCFCCADFWEEFDEAVGA